MEDTMLSAGIDIGTSTTQLVFSKLSIANTGGYGSVPKVEIVDKEIIYKSPIHFTPLQSNSKIDGARVAEIIKEEYKQAGIAPKDLQTGAVIITGETARKRNAKEVVESLAELAGDFVVAAAGPDLESVLAGKGSGAVELSKETHSLVANLDIGGGTTNICYFDDGEVVDTACLNIGGRLLCVEEGVITYVSDTIFPLLEELQLILHIGDRADEAELKKISNRMAEMIAEAIGLKAPSACLKECVTNHGITSKRKPQYIVFSGGVADCIYNKKDSYAYGDIGVLLGRALAKSKDFSTEYVLQASETVHATVVGAGNYSMEVSGSTIAYSDCKFPMKNIPVFKVKLEGIRDIEMLQMQVTECMKRFYDSEVGGSQVVLSMKGISCPTFEQIEVIADDITQALKNEIKKNKMPILILQTDIAKALGQAIKRRIDREKTLLCLDGVYCEEGDFVDIGEPVANGAVVPVVVKTLIFNK